MHTCLCVCVGVRGDGHHGGTPTIGVSGGVGGVLCRAFFHDFALVFPVVAEEKFEREAKAFGLCLCLGGDGGGGGHVLGCLLECCLCFVVGVSVTNEVRLSCFLFAWREEGRKLCFVTWLVGWLVWLLLCVCVCV